MITTDDIGKIVFLRLEIDGGEAKWENEGCILRGFSQTGSTLIVQMPNGQLWNLNPKVVRVLNPRPK